MSYTLDVMWSVVITRHYNLQGPDLGSCIFSEQYELYNII